MLTTRVDLGWAAESHEAHATRLKEMNEPHSSRPPFSGYQPCRWNMHRSIDRVTQTSAWVRVLCNQPSSRISKPTFFNVNLASVRRSCVRSGHITATRLLALWPTHISGSIPCIVTIRNVSKAPDKCAAAPLAACGARSLPTKNKESS